jgi:hypothetical protein
LKKISSVHSQFRNGVVGVDVRRLILI